jgi:hypothetical protein
MFGQVLVEGRARGVLGRQPWGAGLGIGGQKRYQTRALYPGGELYLSAEPGPELRILGVSCTDDLNRDSCARGVDSGMDRSHRARAETADDPVGADLGRVTRTGWQNPTARTSSAHRYFVLLRR